MTIKTYYSRLSTFLLFTSKVNVKCYPYCSYAFVSPINNVATQNIFTIVFILLFASAVEFDPYACSGK
jgi:hypothetical protein